MIDITECIKRMEVELRAMRTVSQETYDGLVELDGESAAALERAMCFLRGTESTPSPAAATPPVPENIRVAAARLMLLKVGADTQDPRWSSWVLDRMLEAVMATPGGMISDVLHALFVLLGESEKPLGRTAANLIKEVTTRSFVKYRGAYNVADFSWIESPPGRRLTAAQAYLELYALPAALIPQAEHRIRQALAGTEFADEAERELQDHEGE